jgi:hypothetical protein
MIEQELFRTIHTELVHKATDPIRDHEKLVDMAGFIYKSELYELFTDGEVGLTIDNKEVFLIEKDGNLNQEAIEQLIIVYLEHLLWKFPNNKIKPFLNIIDIPKEKYELVAWFILYTFVHVNSMLGEMFRGTAELNPEYIKYIVTGTAMYKGDNDKIKKLTSSKFYFNDIEINFK